jgi:16S rRNA (cytosine1402-N4)-methyltransferase
VVSFHSLEDRIVKNFIRNRSQADTFPRGVPVRAADLPTPQLKAIGKAVKPSDAEVRRNPRARSAVLRVAEKN